MPVNDQRSDCHFSSPLVPSSVRSAQRITINSKASLARSWKRPARSSKKRKRPPLTPTPMSRGESPNRWNPCKMQIRRSQGRGRSQRAVRPLEAMHSTVSDCR